MYFFVCSGLQYGGSTLEQSSDISISKLLKIKINIMKGSCISNPNQGNAVNFNLHRGLVFGRLYVAYKDKVGKVWNLGFYPAEVSTLDPEGFFLAIPMTEELRSLILGNWTKGSFNVAVQEGDIFAGSMNGTTPQSLAVVDIPINSRVIDPKPKIPNDNDIKIEETILEEIAAMDFEPIKAEEDIKRQLDLFLKLFRSNKLEDSALTLRNLVMNTLIPLDKSKPEGQQRPLKESLYKTKLDLYDDEERKRIEDLIKKSVQEILEINLSVLHKYIKDSKIIEIPDPDIILYIYKNIVNILEFLEVVEIS